MCYQSNFAITVASLSSGQIQQFCCHNLRQRISSIASSELSVTVRLSAGMRISQSQRGTQIIRAQRDGYTAYSRCTEHTKCVITAPFFISSFCLISSLTTCYIRLMRCSGCLETKWKTAKKIAGQKRIKDLIRPKANQFLLLTFRMSPKIGQDEACPQVSMTNMMSESYSGPLCWLATKNPPDCHYNREATEGTSCHETS